MKKIVYFGSFRDNLYCGKYENNEFSYITDYEKMKIELANDLRTSGATRSKTPNVYQFTVRNVQGDGQIFTATMSGLSKLDINAFLVNKGYEVYQIKTSKLINFLNADFSSFASAYNTFFYAYGFELIKEYVPYIYSKNDEFITDIEFMDMLEDIYNTSLDDLLEWQENFRKCVDFVYNLNGNEEYEEQSIYSKFVAYTIKNDIYTYSQDVEVILDNYINIHNRHRNESIEHLMKGIEDKDPNLELYNVYTSTKLRSICFTILDQLVRQENLPIKTCQICGRYFIPTFRQNEIYCDLPNVDGSATCREKGATINYKKNLESVPALGLYRKMYQQKVMVVYRNKEDRKIKKDFDKWKKEAQAKIKLFKQGKLDEDALYKWMEENK